MDVVRMLAGQFECTRCHGNEWLSIARPDLRQNSIVHRLQCVGCGDRIVAKVSRGGESAVGNTVTHLRCEYETLRALQRSFPADSRYATLEPLGYLEPGDFGVVITRLFPGKDLVHVLRKLDAGGVAEACRAAGGWLRVLHQHGDGLEPRGFDAADKLAYLAERYGAVLLRGNAKVRAACRGLERESLRIGTPVLRTVRLHGDFKPENMLCDGRRYAGLDVQWRTTGPAEYDLAPFLNHLWLAGRRPGLPAGRHYQLAEREFLAGYGYRDDIRILRWAQLYFALCQLGGYRRRGYLAAAYAHWKIWPLVRRLVEPMEHWAAG